MAIVTLPLPIQLINGNVADGGQVMTDLNAIASNVNANAAKNGVNSDITALLAITTIAPGLTITGATISTSTFNNGTITNSTITATGSVFTNITIIGGSISGVTIDGTSTGVTQAAGTANTTLATTAFAANLAFNTALPLQTGNADKYVTTNGSVASWSDLIKVGTIKLADSTDTTKRAQFVLSAITTGTTRLINMPDRDVTLGSGILTSNRTANTILATADLGSLVEITANTFTQTFTAAATLGSSWFVYYYNNGTGDITLDPNGAELIDGLTSYIMYPGEARLITCTGTAFQTVIISPFQRTFTATGTFTRPPGYAYFSGLLWAAGGSGGSGGSTSGVSGTGGGGGMCFPFMLAAAAIGTSQTVTIGAGGTSVSGAAVVPGIAGGNSTFGALVTSFGGGGGFGTNAVAQASGGAGGGALSAGPAGGAAGVVGGSPTNLAVGGIDNSGLGGGGSSSSGAAGGVAAWGGAGGGSNNGTSCGGGGSTIYGGAGGGATSNTGTITGGTSVFGGAGGAAGALGTGNNGVAGSAPGGGGGGTRTTGTSGAGARGECRIWGTV